MNEFQGKDIVLLMDNAVIHKHSQVLETIRSFNVNVIFNAQYSPWLNPIEFIFGLLKSKLKSERVATRYK